MAGTVSDSAQSYFQSMTEIFGRLEMSLIDRYAELLFGAWRERRRVLVFGNGGSAFTASHHVLDYVKTAEVPKQPRLLALSMVDNMGITTAVGNDSSYEETLVYPLESYASAGDLAVAISCSGNSPNVVRACRWAREHDLTVVALTGFAGGEVGPIADLHINIPSENYGIIEDIQMSIGHIAAQMLQQRVAREVNPA